MASSLFPVQQDLNLLPSAAGGSGGGACGAIVVVPKIEPKLEPLDETELLALHQGSYEYPSSGDAITSPSLSSDGGGRGQLPEDWDDVYSEFHRISELFRSAFAESEAVDPDLGNLGRAIVVVPEEEEEGSFASVVAPSAPAHTPSRKKPHQRSSELVRVAHLAIADQRYYRSVVRKTRMVYDSLRICAVVEEEKRARMGMGSGRRARGDLRAASLLRERGMWLNRDKRIVGAIPGVDIGDLFFFRMELLVVGLHGQAQAGIDYVPASQSSNGEPIATSVIVSGGYEDDEDGGDVIIYTGQGGQDKFSRQCGHQKLETGNLALERSMRHGIELRVIRGFKYEGSASGKVYVYDGLYKILDYWFDVGKSGFGVYKYKLLRMEGQPEMGSAILKFAQNLRTTPLSLRPVGYVSLDVSMKKEGVPVFVFNDLDQNHDPLYYEYLVKTIFPPYVFHSSGSDSGCACVQGCTDDCFCAMKNGGAIPYDQNGLLLKGKPLVFECGNFCQCPPNCRNRVAQKGVRNRLEVFRSRETGWGVRSLDLIQAGSFICEYAGIVLTGEQVSVFTMNGDSLVHPSRFSNRWAEWGDLSQIYADYVQPSYPSIPPLDFAMDVSKMRNVASYISHSLSPNVLVQFLLYDHNNILFPRLAVFAMENIPPLKELSLDYGVPDECTGKLRICN